MAESLRNLVRAVAWSLAVLLAAVPAAAQRDLLAPAGGDVVPAVPVGEVQVDMDRFGFSGAARAGEWTGIRLRLLDRAERQRDVLIRIAVPDPDGDPTQYRVAMTTNPGLSQPVWVYLRLPGRFESADLLNVTVFEAEEGGDGVVREGRVIGQTRVSPPRLLDSTESVAAVIGDRSHGLGQYGTRYQNSSYAPLGHELLDARTGNTPDDLPDRWYGLAPVELVVWTRGSPGDLTIEQVRALREWVERGGHLIVCLPPVGQDWITIANRELAEMMPAVSVSRRTGVDLNEYATLLTSRADAVLPQSGTVHTLAPRADADPGHAMRVLNGPDGECVVARRLVGAGAVTLIGIDFGHPGLMQAGLPEAAVFWHRVLGRRGLVMSQAELAQVEARSSRPLGFRTTVDYDQDLSSSIAKSGRAVAGVFLGFVVFAVYWIAAGPGGFGLLKRRQAVKHAWVAFLATSLVFTGLAWGGALLLRPKRLEATHLTFLDHVYGERKQRTRTWMSLLVPSYGEATVAVGDEPVAVGGQRVHHGIAPWDPPRTLGVSGRGGFPDARGYTVDGRSPNSMTFPTRATVKQLMTDWSGGMAWRSIRPVVDATGNLDTAVRFRRGDLGNHLLEGVLTHELPGGLENVVIVVVRRQQPMWAPPSDQLICAAYAFKRTGVWQPGEPLNLELATVLSGTDVLAQNYLGDLTRMASSVPGGFGEQAADPRRAPDRMTALALFSHLAPPDFSRGLTDTNAPVLARRAGAQRWDLGRWFTQPCVIVIGHLKASGKDSCPTPMRVSIGGQDRAVHFEGTTVVRWIYPLPDDPPAVMRPGRADEPSGDGATQGGG
ncbi:MAG: hypothetical protein KJZ54_11815 [Phycisphaerales bacterium]|nr:hypothetical protein [Phycisphaerales bacterium]